jgi:hypothetical protein
MVVVCSILYAPVFLGFPYVVYRYIADAAVYGNTSDHEKRLQCWELSYLFNLDEFWLRGQLFLVSSLKREAIYYRFDIILLKAALLFIFIFVRSNLALQGLLFTAFIVAFFFKYAVANWPFRDNFSNALSFVTLSLLLSDSIFGMMNSFGVENAVMVASAETIWLLCINAAGLFLILLTFGFCLFSPGAVWPTMATLHRIRCTPGLAQKAAKWVDKLREARTTREIFLRTPTAVADFQGLEELLRVLRKCWLSARSHGSIFEIHLQEAMEDLVAIHSRTKPDAFRRFDYWNEAYLDATEAGTFSSQLSSYPLMATRKKRVLLKLFAIRALKAPAKGYLPAKPSHLGGSRKLGDDGNRTRGRASVRGANGRSKQFISFQSEGGKPSSAAATSSHNSSERIDEYPLRIDTDFQGNGIEGEEESLLDDMNGDDGYSMETLLQLIDSLEIRSNAILNKKLGLGTGPPPMSYDSFGNDPAAGGASVGTDALGLEIAASEIEECYIMWDDAINLYEQEQLPGQDLLSGDLVESWYTYRAALLSRLQEVEALEQCREEEEQRKRREIMEELEKADRARQLLLQQQNEQEEILHQRQLLQMQMNETELEERRRELEQSDQEYQRRLDENISTTSQSNFVDSNTGDDDNHGSVVPSPIGDGGNLGSLSPAQSPLSSVMSPLQSIVALNHQVSWSLNDAGQKGHQDSSDIPPEPQQPIESSAENADANDKEESSKTENRGAPPETSKSAHSQEE